MIPGDVLDKVYNYTIGSCAGVDDIADRFNLHDYDVEELLVDMGLEVCPQCGWWTECGELADEDDLDDYQCNSCRGWG